MLAASVLHMAQSYQFASDRLHYSFPVHQACSRHIPAVFLLCAQAMDHFNGGLPCLGDLAGQCAAQDDANLVRPIARFPFVKGTPYQEGEYYSST